MLGVLIGQVQPVVATAAPATHVAPAQLLSITKETATRSSVWVFSPSMQRRIKLFVLTPRTSSGPRPTLYMLDGAGARNHDSGWLEAGNAESFFADKNVTVVLPTGAYGTFYTDWERPDPKVGKPMWDTFLTKELPSVIDANFDGNGRNGIAGLSMGAQSAFTLASRNPSLYRAVGSLSGCPPVSTPEGEAFVRATIGRSGGNADNMWGPVGSAGWRDHDAGLRLDALRGKTLFLYAGQGQIGPQDIKRNVTPEEGLYQVVLASSSAFELAAYNCSRQFAGQLAAAKVGFVDGFSPVGTHHWYYWAKELPSMWAVLSRGL